MKKNANICVTYFVVVVIESVRSRTIVATKTAVKYNEIGGLCRNLWWPFAERKKIKYGNLTHDEKKKHTHEICFENVFLRQHFSSFPSKISCTKQAKCGFFYSLVAVQ